MPKLAVLVLAASTAGLAGCTAYDPYYTANPPNPDPYPRATTAPAPVSVPVATYRPGSGVVESIALARPAASATAGGSVGTVVHPSAYQLTVRMDDGSLQSVLQDNRNFLVGDRVQLTNDGRIIRH